ncbi:MAG TPA: FtsH protease activity modulator HflK [Alphaproteobacteria bacterium]|nr:FtsH protease activity modulator HflK [Alphaproteobacteria bacterium]
MPWNNQGGGGPWGGGGGGSNNPWGRGGGGFGGNRPPDLEELLRKSQDRFRQILPGGMFGSGRGLLLVILAVLIVWFAFGIYRVQPEEQGVELVFGKWIETTSPGLHYNWPAPIGHVETPKVTRVNRVEVGFRTSFDNSRSTSTRDVGAESLMLTGDENIIDIQFVVFWVINDAGKFLFHIRNPEETVKSAAESAMREIIGKTAFEFARTQGRANIEAEARELMQSILDQYGSGVLVMQVEMQRVDPPGSVLEAFRDVQAARADKERAINEAQAYFNEVTQKAAGTAERVIKEAEAYKLEKIAVAKGEAQRFVSLYQEYSVARDVTRRRLYLETMERVLADMNKVLVEGGSTATGTVPYLPLTELLNRAHGLTPGSGETARGQPASEQAGAGGTQ